MAAGTGTASISGRKNPSAATAPGSKGTGAFLLYLLRVLVAGGLIWLAWWGIPTHVRHARAEYIGRREENRGNQPGEQFNALNGLREALRLAPTYPPNIARRATLMVTVENQKARVKDFGAFDGQALAEALAMMESIRETHLRPSDVERKLAEVSSMLSAMELIRNNRTQADAYANLCTDHSVEFLRLIGQPYHEPGVFYKSAIRRAFQVNRHAEVLFFFEHCRRYYPREATADPEIMELVNRSRLEIGEGPVMMADTIRQLMVRPREPRLLGECIRAGLLYGEAAAALAMMQELERRGLMNAELRQFESRLAAVRDTARR